MLAIPLVLVVLVTVWMQLVSVFHQSSFISVHTLSIAFSRFVDRERLDWTSRRLTMWEDFKIWPSFNALCTRRMLGQMRLTVGRNWRRTKSRRSVLWRRRRGRRRRKRTEQRRRRPNAHSLINEQWMYPPADQNVYTFRLESKSTCNWSEINPPTWLIMTKNCWASTTIMAI